MDVGRQLQKITGGFKGDFAWLLGKQRAAEHQRGCEGCGCETRV